MKELAAHNVAELKQQTATRTGSIEADAPHSLEGARCSLLQPTSAFLRRKDVGQMSPIYLTEFIQTGEPVVQ